MDKACGCDPAPLHRYDLAAVWRHCYSKKLIHNKAIVVNLWFQELRGDVWEYPSNVICFLNGVFLGNEKQLASWAENQWNFTLTHPEDFYTAITEEYYAKHLQKTGVGWHHSCKNT